ncbi:hypothetical protein [Haliangium sp.]|uniref:hypothetical protein n=1 Tax=Haliangium sp. TaxID=2663208 RepID=UPI003D0BEB11
MQDWLSRFIDFVRGAWRELPIEGAAVGVAALSSIALVHLDNHAGVDAAQTWCLRLILAALVTTPIAYALTGLRGRGVIGRGVQLGVGAGVLVAVTGVLALCLGDVDEFGRDGFLWPYGLALLAATLMPFVGVAVGQGEGRLERFTRFVRRFFEQTTTWGLLWIGAMGALGVVFMALHELFDLDVERLWADASLVLTGGFVLTYLYRLMPAYGSGDGRLPELWRRLATTVGAPFVSVMLTILVVYEAVVVARGELPRNLLSPLIIAAGFVGFLCTLVIVAILREGVGSGTLAPVDPHRWARRRSVRLARAFPLVLLVLLPMAGWALSVRIEQYGFTPFRVVRLMALLCLGVMSALGTWRWLRGRTALTWEVPACMIGFALATAFGPTSAVSLSLASQSERLEQQLISAGVVDRGVAAESIEARRTLPYEQFDELRDTLQIVAELGGEDALRRSLDGEVSACAERWSGWDCLARLGVEAGPASDSYPRYENLMVEGPFPVEAGALSQVELDTYRDQEVGHRWLTLIGPTRVDLREGVRTIGSASLDGHLATWRDTGKLPARPVALTDDDGAVVGHLVVWRLDVMMEAEGEAELQRVHGVWIERSRP